MTATDDTAQLSEAYLSSIEEVIEDARNGRMVVLVDDESRRWLRPTPSTSWRNTAAG